MTKQIFLKKRMHSSRMRTTHSSSRHRERPGPDPPQLPPWVWAWTRSSSTSPLGVGLDQSPPNFPLGSGPGDLPPGPDPPTLPPWVWAWKPARHAGTRHPPLGPGTPPVNRITDTCKNITLPQTSFAGGNN